VAGQVGVLPPPTLHSQVPRQRRQEGHRPHGLAGVVVPLETETRHQKGRPARRVLPGKGPGPRSASKPVIWATRSGG
jgi:hypothetical protein